MARRAPTLPKQARRTSQDLAGAADQQTRDHRATADHLRGEGKLHDMRQDSGTQTKVRHGLGRIPKGWMVLSLRCGGAVDAHPREVARDDSTLTIAWDGSNAIAWQLWVY